MNFCVGPKEETKLEDWGVAIGPHSTCLALLLTTLQAITALEI